MDTGFLVCYGRITCVLAPLFGPEFLVRTLGLVRSPDPITETDEVRRHEKGCVTMSGRGPKPDAGEGTRVEVLPSLSDDDGCTVLCTGGKFK